MAEDVSQGTFKGAAPKPDTSPQAKGASEAHERLDHHEGRLSACEAKLGIKPEKGVAKEETASSASRMEKSRERKRH